MSAFLMTQLTNENITLSRADGGQLEVIPKGGSGGALTTRIYSGNAEAGFAASFAPGAVAPGTPLLCIGPFTPIASGLMVFEAMFQVTMPEESTDVPVMAANFIELVTAVTGGAVLAGAVPPGSIILTPTSTTPADTTGTTLFGYGLVTQDDTVDGRSTVLFSLQKTFQATPGVAAALVVRAISESSRTWTAVAGSVSLIEQP